MNLRCWKGDNLFLKGQRNEFDELIKFSLFRHKYVSVPEQNSSFISIEFNPFQGIELCWMEYRYPRHSARRYPGITGNS